MLDTSSLVMLAFNPDCTVLYITKGPHISLMTITYARPNGNL